MARASAALLGVLLAALSAPLAGMARGQDAAPANTAAAPDEAAASDDAWRKYDAAFEALLAGRRELALRLLAEIQAAAPAHPAAQLAAELLAVKAVGTREPEPENVRDETATRGARAELASFQTFHGIAVGIELCLLLECNDPTAAIASLTLLGGVGLGTALVATSGGIRPGTTALLDSGVQWGAWNAIAIGVAGNYRSRAFAGTLLLGQGLGLAAGGALAATLRPTVGQVSLANTVGLWSGLLTAFAHGADDFSGTRKNIMLTLLATSDLGVAGGALLAARFPISRGHALLIDAGGAAGALSSLGITALIGGNGTKSQTYYLAMIPGTLVGLAASAFLTRHWDAPSLPFDVAVAPLADGHGATAGIGGRF